MKMRKSKINVTTNQNKGYLEGNEPQNRNVLSDYVELANGVIIPRALYLADIRGYLNQED